MTTPPAPRVPPTPEAAALAATYRDLLPFMEGRAGRGDATARSLATAFTRPGHPHPSRAMVRAWLARCAAEIRLIRPTSEPYSASWLLARLSAVEARAPGLADRVWGEVIEALRAEHGARPSPPR